MVLSPQRVPTDVTESSAASVFLDGLTNRDYARLASALDGDVRFRALLPSGPNEWHGPDQVAGVLRGWFGSADDFVVVGTTRADVAGRTQMTWRFRLRPAPFEIGDGWHVIEQHAFADATAASIQALDLVCSGFRPDVTTG